MKLDPISAISTVGNVGCGPGTAEPCPSDADDSLELRLVLEDIGWYLTPWEQPQKTGVDPFLPDGLCCKRAPRWSAQCENAPKADQSRSQDAQDRARITFPKVWTHSQLMCTHNGMSR